MHGNICSDQISDDLAIMTCLACAKEKANNPSAEATGGGGDGGEGEDVSTSDEEQDTTEGTSGDDEVIVLAVEGATGLQKVINNSTLDHIIVDQTECNPTDGRKKDPIKTKLRTISGIPVAKLTRALLISFCNRVNSFGAIRYFRECATPIRSHKYTIKKTYEKRIDDENKRQE